MQETTTLGAYLRDERERRGLTLRTISEQTKVSLPLLEGLESDDISRWPGGIFRRSFVRTYAEAVGLDPDAIFRRFEQQHKLAPPELSGVDGPVPPAELGALTHGATTRVSNQLSFVSASARARYLGTVADLTVAAVLAFGSAAAGSRLLWPVLMIAAYYAVGVLLTGTSPMVALLSASDATTPHPSPTPRPSRQDRDDEKGADDVDSLLGHHASPRSAS